MLQDSLLNLILNSREAIGADPGTIAVAARRLEDIWIEITVRDTGSGFSKAALDHALDPFFTTKGGEGSGLGLSMVYDMAALSGGHLRISNDATGAVASLRLPYRLAAEPGAAGGLVLLVEDSDDIRASVREMLIAMGDSVIEATNVDEALEIATPPGIAAVLSDISLIGERAGLDLGEILRRRSQAPPVFLMTALAPNDPLRRRAAERFPIISKPFSEDALARFLSVRSAA